MFIRTKPQLDNSFFSKKKKETEQDNSLICRETTLNRIDTVILIVC